VLPELKDGSLDLWAPAFPRLRRRAFPPGGAFHDAFAASKLARTMMCVALAALARETFAVISRATYDARRAFDFLPHEI
jgi:hypothetical protein